MTKNQQWSRRQIPRKRCNVFYALCGIVGISQKGVNRHECGKGECPSCAENVVNLKQHRCHLQPIRQRKKNHRRDDSDTVEEHPVCIYLIYYDIEKPDKTRAILCAEMDQYGQQFTFQGETCLGEFLAWIHDIAIEKR